MTVIVGVVSLGLLFGLERFVKKVPAVLTVGALGVLYIEQRDDGRRQPVEGRGQRLRQGQEPDLERPSTPSSWS